MSALSYTTSAPLRNSSLMTRPTVTSLPGMALAEMMTLSPGPMSTCLWVEARYGRQGAHLLCPGSRWH